MARYSIGVDFGTLSARALLVDAQNGRELASAELAYPHAVMSKQLAVNGAPLPPDYALQDPADYLCALEHILPDVLEKAGVSPREIVGIGVDFTCSTLLSLNAAGEPLCFEERFRETPLAYALLWKHHAAKEYAARITEVARARGEGFLAHYGGKIDEEWALPKLYQLLEEAPAVCEAAARFAEAGDWIVQTLTGRVSHSYQYAAYKSHYHPQKGYPGGEFLAEVDARLARATEQKLAGTVSPMGACVGYVTKEAAARFGLREGTPVATAMADGHCAGLAVGLRRSGDMLAVLGTSGCFMALGEQDAAIPGICGSVKDGILPGLYGYEAGLCTLGDHFAYAATHLVGEREVREAKERGISTLKLLIERASQKKPGESGVLALNWFNGNRSTLVDGSLSGLFVGLTLQTAPEDLMRALIEATAFGARNIVENFEQNGVEIRRIVACGGIARKDAFTMQLYADVLGREVAVSATAQAPALGAAICAAAAAGLYPSVSEAVACMKAPVFQIYRPNGANLEIYNELYAEYKVLHDYFGRGENTLMKKLRRLSAQQREC